MSINFCQDITIYEEDPNHYCDLVHQWFNADVAEQKRTDTRRHLQALISLEKYKQNRQNML